MAENASVGDLVNITALATDPDGTDTVTYALSDNAGGLFAIDTNTGIVTVANALDYETATSHSITVLATSTDGTTASQAFTITVTDINESSIGAVTDDNAAINAIAENAALNDNTGITALANDPDGTDTVSYTVDDSRFTVDGSGIVRVTDGAGFDAETEATIYLTITATSSDGSTANEIFDISVTDIDEYDVTNISDSNTTANIVPENAAAGTVVGITAFAADDDLLDSVTYSLANNGNGLFQIDPDTGVISVAGPLDFESASSHLVTVIATSSDASVSAKTLRIDVADLDDTTTTTNPDPAPDGNTETNTGSGGDTTPELPPEDNDNENNDESQKIVQVDVVETVLETKQSAKEESSTDEEVVGPVIPDNDDTIQLKENDSTEGNEQEQYITYVFDKGELKRISKKTDHSGQQNTNPDVSSALKHLKTADFSFEYPDTETTPFSPESSQPDWFEVDHKTMQDHIEIMQEEMDEAFEEATQKNKAQLILTGGVSISLAAGAVSYLLRAGSLMSSFLATIPIWKGFDPIGVLIAPRKKDKKKPVKEEIVPQAKKPDQDVETMFNGE